MTGIKLRGASNEPSIFGKRTVSLFVKLWNLKVRCVFIYHHYLTGHRLHMHIAFSLNITYQCGYERNF